MIIKLINNIIKKIDKIDIKILKNHFVELYKEHSDLITVFNSMSEGVLVLNNKSEITFFNKMAQRIFQISDNSEGETIDKVLKDQRIITLLFDSLAKEEKIYERECRIANSFIEFVSFSIQPLVRNGKIIGNIIIVQDISEKKENEKKLKQAESLAALTTISAGIAHEIKNPLGAISIHVQLINQDVENLKCKSSNDIKYSLNIINDEIERLNDIVINYLYTVRPLKTELMVVNLRVILDSVVDLILPELDSKNIKFIKNFGKLPDLWIDEKYMKQALLNLIKNSINAVEHRDGVIELSVRVENNYVNICIMNNGEGIPDDVQSKIFDPYFTTKDNGTGLGLTIVYKIIKEHNGDITFSSIEGETVFIIKLPLPFTEKGLIGYDGDSNKIGDLENSQGVDNGS